MDRSVMRRSVLGIEGNVVPMSNQQHVLNAGPQAMVPVYYNNVSPRVSLAAPLPPIPVNAPTATAMYPYQVQVHQGHRLSISNAPRPAAVGNQTWTSMQGYDPSGYNYGRQPTPGIVALPYQPKPSNVHEIELAMGDTVMVMGVWADGTGYGTNARTGQTGYFPLNNLSQLAQQALNNPTDYYTTANSTQKPLPLPPVPVSSTSATFMAYTQAPTTTTTASHPSFILSPTTTAPPSSTSAAPHSISSTPRNLNPNPETASLISERTKSLPRPGSPPGTLPPGGTLIRDKKKQMARVVGEYVKKRDDEIGLKVGMEVAVQMRFDDGWGYGSVENG
ncbi:hypothetical protein HK102_010624 [Quaeritorhiza haematococci]|nr:hypothetical protein HK102_010624 [Quaeritorhiza haematococci]